MGIKISIRQMVKLHLKSPSLLECFYAKYFTMFAWKSKGEGRVDYDEDKIIFWFRKSVERLCVSWALPFIECVAVWALKLPVVSAPLRSLHNRSPPDFLQLIPTHSKPTSLKVFLLYYWNSK